jgi:hypothetical protein
MPPEPDFLAAELAAIKQRSAILGEPGAAYRTLIGRAQCLDSAADVPPLLAAVDRVLKLHQPGARVVLGALCDRHEVCRHFSITATEAAGVMACTDCKADVYQSCTGCGEHVNVEKCPVRTVITGELLSKEADRG